MQATTPAPPARSCCVASNHGYVPQVVVGIDPSTKASGYAVFNDGRLLFADKAPARTAAEVTHLVDWLLDMHVETGASVLVGIEHSYVGANVRTGLQLAELRGRISQEVERRGWSVQLIAPSTWRKTTIAPPPKTKRKQLKAMSVAYVDKNYGLTVSDDVADAICVGEHLARGFQS